MFELAVLLLSLGAMGIHAELFSTATLVLIGWSLFLVILFCYRSVVSGIAGVLLAGVFVVGGLFIYSIETTSHILSPGELTITGVVKSVDRRLSQSAVIVRDEETGERVQFFLRKETALLPGDVATFQGTVQLPKVFTTDTGRIFDYPHYLESKGVSLVGYNPEEELVRRGSVSLVRIATETRFAIADTFARFIQFPVDGVIAGMVVGYQGALPQTIKDLFRDTGVLHVLVLSGYNIMLLAGALAFVLRALPFRLRTIVSLCAIALLVLVSGAGVASIRAGIMGSIALLAGLSVRSYRPFRALCVAYVLFFVVSPGVIFYDPGFHLSFLATIYMVFVFPKLLARISLPEHKVLRGGLEAVLLACTIPLFMLPYTMYFSGMLPLATVIANILLALCIPLLMGGGIAVVLFSWSVPLASLFGTIVSWAGKEILDFLVWCARLPLWETPFLSGWGVLAIYAVFFVLVFWKELRLFVLDLKGKFSIL